ncbi:hypothetical protein DFT25_14380 [Salmonella enterica]|nr:hypothetical protein [Salmonella enterica]EBE2299515.1 hypothetical protein [Salmonella enterica]
MCAINKFIPW